MSQWINLNWNELTSLCEISGPVHLMLVGLNSRLTGGQNYHEIIKIWYKLNNRLLTIYVQYYYSSVNKFLWQPLLLSTTTA